MTGYKRIKEGVFSLEIKRSQFIAYSYAVETEAEAADKLSAAL